MADDDKTVEETPAGTTVQPTAVSAPMLTSDTPEPQGPEDAAGFGPKRGDYRGLVSRGTTVIPNPKAGQEGEPATITVDQQAQAENIGDDPGVKGGTRVAPDGPPVAPPLQ